MELNKLRDIAKAKLRDKSKLGDWYTTRLEICSMCPKNTANIPILSFKQKALKVVNGGDACTTCGCGLRAKASLETSVCGLVDIGQEPLWEAVDLMTTLNSNFIQFTNLSPDKVDMRDKTTLELNYGNIRKGSNSAISIYMEGMTKDLLDVSMRSSCGCTTPTPEKLGKGYKLNIIYDTTRVGLFSKDILVGFSRGKINESFKITIKGNVI